MALVPAVEVYAELNRVRSPGGADFVIRNCLVTPCPPEFAIGILSVVRLVVVERKTENARLDDQTGVIREYELPYRVKVTMSSYCTGTFFDFDAKCYRPGSSNSSWFLRYSSPCCNLSCRYR